MINNIVPESLIDKFCSKECLGDIYSFCVSNDGISAVICGCSYDPDFPEVYIYNSESDELTEIDFNSELIDFPLGKAFFGENEGELYVKNWYDGQLYYVSYDLSNEQIIKFNSFEGSEYTSKLDKIVFDLVHDDYSIEENKVSSIEKKSHQNIFDEFLQFVQSSIRVNKRMLNGPLAKQFGNQNPSQISNESFGANFVYTQLIQKLDGLFTESNRKDEFEDIMRMIEIDFMEQPISDIVKDSGDYSDSGIIHLDLLKDLTSLLLVSLKQLEPMSSVENNTEWAGARLSYTQLIKSIDKVKSLSSLNEGQKNLALYLD